jgi:hypothetical protein
LVATDKRLTQLKLVNRLPLFKVITPNAVVNDMNLIDGYTQILRCGFCDSMRTGNDSGSPGIHPAIKQPMVPPFPFVDAVLFDDVNRHAGKPACQSRMKVGQELAGLNDLGLLLSKIFCQSQDTREIKQTASVIQDVDLHAQFPHPVDQFTGLTKHHNSHVCLLANHLVQHGNPQNLCATHAQRAVHKRNFKFANGGIVGRIGQEIGIINVMGRRDLLGLR